MNRERTERGIRRAPVVRWGLVLALALACGSSVAWGFRSRCSEHGGTGAYTVLQDYKPAIGFRDVCTFELNATCTDCTMSDEEHAPRWVHCAEDEFGTIGECDHYDDWEDIPPLPGGQRRKVIMGG